MNRIFTGRRLKAFKRGMLGLALPLSMGTAQAAAGVSEQIIPVGNGLALETLVVAPDATTEQPLGVLVMNHGFLLNQKFYRDILAQIAAEGFVVIAPQAYKSGGLPFGKPTTEVEAANISKSVTWFSTHLEEIVGRPVDFNKLGLVSHSRGSKVSWTILRDKLLNAQAVAAIDPVDGTQDGSARVTGNGYKLPVPALIIGTGLGSQSSGFGQACAPADVGHVQFWATVQSSPSWLNVAQDYGHMDFLDDKVNCGVICGLCAKASGDKSRPEFRSYIAQKVSSFMKGVLYKDEASLNSLDEKLSSVVEVAERR